MSYLAKAVYYLLRDVFMAGEDIDLQDAAGERTGGCSPLVVGLLILSLCVNGWLFYKFVGLAIEFIDYKQTQQDCEK